jgi:hypothetical protein
MTFDWYKIYNLLEFIALGIPSKEYELAFEGLGVKTVMAVRGNTNAVVFDDVMLIINFNNQNPFAFENRAVYLDENNDVWVGVAVES